MTPATLAGYRATKDASGVLTVHGVPIFVECSRGKHEFDAEWIQQAVDKAKAAEADGYLPPLHVRHHEDGADVRAAGFFRITGTTRMQFRGVDRLAVLADLVITDPTVAHEVLAKRYPYRSVEIFNVGTPALDSLALLDHEAPFLELPMLMVSRVDESAPVASATFARRLDSTVAAIFRRGHSAALLFQMDDDKPKDDEKPFPPKGEGADGAEGEKAQADGENAAEPEVAKIVEAIQSGSISVAGLQQIVEAIKARSGAGAEQEEGEEDGEKQSSMNEPAPAPAPGRREAMSKDKKNMDPTTMKQEPQGDLAVQMAKLAGENEALKARLDSMEAERKRDQEVAVAMKRLDGRPLGADLEQRLVAFHAKYGSEAFGAFVEAMAMSSGPIAGTAAADAAAMKAGEKVPEVAMKYQERGAEAVKRAVHFAREWEQLREHGATRVSQESYVQIQMESAQRSN